MSEKNDVCTNCVYGQHVVTTNDLQKIRYCRRYPPNIPMPGPGGQGVVFVNSLVNDKGWCGEWAPAITQ